MAGKNGAAPFLISGGGIGGLVTAYALAQKGFPVRVFEQSPEFREVGAGIQLGPNIFRVLEKIGLKDAVLADAHRPPGQEMRDALTGKLITRMPLDETFMARFGQPYAVTHRADIHGTFLRACQSRNLITLETSRRVDGYEDHGDRVALTMENDERVEGRALIACDGMWSKIRERIVGDGKPRVSGHIAYRAVLKRDQVPDDLWRPDVVLWAGPRTHFVHYPLRRGELFNLVAVFHSDQYEEGWNAEGNKDLLWKHFQGQRPEVLRLLELIDVWRLWVLCDREPVKNWSNGRVVLLGDAAHPDAAISGARRLHGDRGRRGAGGQSRGLARRSAGGVQGLSTEPLLTQRSRPDHGARLWRILSRARRHRRVARDGDRRRTPEQAYESIAWLYGGP
ncbi:MAG: FAD-dependent monooxygenase [Pseudolabrys sp.]